MRDSLQVIGLISLQSTMLFSPLAEDVCEKLNKFIDLFILVSFYTKLSSKSNVFAFWVWFLISSPFAFKFSFFWPPSSRARPNAIDQTNRYHQNAFHQHMIVMLCLSIILKFGKIFIRYWQFSVHSFVGLVWFAFALTHFTNENDKHFVICLHRLDF